MTPGSYKGTNKTLAIITNMRSNFNIKNYFLSKKDLDNQKDYENSSNSQLVYQSLLPPKILPNNKIPPILSFPILIIADNSPTAS